MTEYNRALWPVTIALALLGVFTPQMTITAVVVLGQAHFGLTYFYQARAGKITRRYCMKYLLAVLAIGLFLAATDYSIRALLLLTGSIFSIHFIADEAHLLELRQSPLTRALSALFTLTYGSYILAQTYGIDITPYPAGLLLCIALLYAWKQRSFREWYFAALGITLSVVLLSQWAVPYEKILASIILLHYARWYYGYFLRLETKILQQRYLKNVALANALIMAGFILYSRNTNTPFLSSLWIAYDLRCFYVWTLLHIAASLRLPKTS